MLKKILIGVGVLFVAFIAIGVLAGGGSKTDTPTITVQPTAGVTGAPPVEKPVPTAVPTVAPQPTVVPTPAMTSSQANAVESAKSYLDLSGFSRQGLIDQLLFEEYSVEDATFAVDRAGADWNEEASESATSYLQLTAFSRQGLIEQLLFEGFTPAEAEYGVNAAY